MERPPVRTPPDDARALAVRLFLAMLGAQELLTIYLGVRLGLYAQLAQGPATPALLAERAGIAPRYAREWLEQQAVAGLLAVSEQAPDGERAYRLSPGHAEVLLESDSPRSMVALTTLPLGGIARALPALLAAYRSGEGVPDATFGDDWRDGHSGANRSLFTHLLPGWVRSALPHAHAALEAGGCAVDVACGAGHAAVALACAYPAARVHGLDVDARTIALACDAAAAAGVGERVTFEVRDAADPALAGDYDLVCLFDALHELAQPVPVLRACRQLRRAGGEALVMDAKVAPAFVTPGDEIERFQYATSVLHCLPACLASQPSAGTGTVMRVEQVRAYARAAGFEDARVLPIDDRFHRFYRLAG